MLTLPPTEETLARAAAMLADDRLVVIPTETVYGLAANAWSPTAVGKIFAAKGRPVNNPLIVHVASLERLGEAVALPLSARRQNELEQLTQWWPGPLTLVLPRGEQIPDCVTAGRPTVAVRIPSHPVARELLNRCPFPLAAPSANRSKYISPTSAAHCSSGLGELVELVIDGGPCECGVESTIVALSDDGPRLLRPGAITAEAIARRLNVSVAELTKASHSSQAAQPPAPGAETDADCLLAPGMMLEHYAPTTPLRLLVEPPPAQVPPTHVPARSGRIAFQPLRDHEAARFTVVETLSPTGDLSEVARHLFAALRRLDQAGLEAIYVDTCQPIGVGRAIMDRLNRAAAGHAS